MEPNSTKFSYISFGVLGNSVTSVLLAVTKCEMKDLALIILSIISWDQQSFGELRGLRFSQE